MYRVKTRTLPTNLGEAGDSLYYASTSSTTSTIYPTLSDQWFMDSYNAGMLARGTLVNVPYNDEGTEYIEWSAQGRDTYNECRHQVTGRVNLPFNVAFERYGKPWTIYLYPYFRMSQPSYAQWSVSTIKHPTVDFTAARARAWHNMQPRFEGEVSMLNFLLELKDFRDVSKFIFLRESKDKILQLRKLFAGAADNLRRSTKPSLRPGPGVDPTKAAASAVLLKNFALDPLVRDLVTMFAQAATLATEAQLMFMRDGMVYQTSHYTEEIDRSESMTYYPYNNNYIYKYGTQNFTKFTATLKYRYDYSMRSTVDAFCKYWGLSGSFEAFWNAIPFSFIADYFIQIGNSIRAMEHDPHVRIHHWYYGESLKTTYQAGWVTSGDTRMKRLILNGQLIKPQHHADQLLAGTMGSIYTRRLTQPYYGPATPRVRIPSGKQGLNLLCLARCLL